MRRAARICGQPGCPAIVVGHPKCDEHTVTRTQRQAKDPAQAKFYRSTLWKKTSLMVRRQEPFCRECGRERSAIADHIDGDWRNNARANLRGLGKDCNATITAKQHRAKAQQHG